MNPLRVSVATYNQVVFPHPENARPMLALERKGTVLQDGNVNVRAQPFGGGVKILDSKPLEELIGEIQFDSERSKQEQDFRILIKPSHWESVKEYCLLHLRNQDDPYLEAHPDRELIEEFEETLGLGLKSDQYEVQPVGFVVENHPVQTGNEHARGQLTVRLYRTFEVLVTDPMLCHRMLTASRQVSDHELEFQALKDAERGGSGHACAILTLPLGLAVESYRALSPDMRYRKMVIEGHELDESVLAILDVGVPQYERI